MSARGAPPGLRLLSGTGNRFWLADLRAGGELHAPEVLARELCGGGVLRGGSADGLLVLEASSAGADARLRIFNADGSRASACGNGLRCAGWVVLGETPEGRALRIETDAGTRRVERIEARASGALVRASMGRGRCFALAAPVRHAGMEFPALGVLLGNAHCVLRVPDERTAPVAELGAALQRHPDFPEGVNVGFLAQREGAWHLRVFERGVGETAACGSGACAAAISTRVEGRHERTFRVRLPGGTLAVEWSAEEELLLTGEVLDLDAGTA